MTAGLDIRNTDGNIVIDQNYDNLYLSRKIQASTLPVDTPWMENRFYGRRITLAEDEVIAAVGVPNGGNCPYWIHYGITDRHGDSFAWRTPYVYSAQEYFPVNGGALQPWNESQIGISTGINDTSYVGEDVYVYVFAKTKNKTATQNACGLQVFDENGNICYDSNDKSARVLYFGGEPCNLPSNKTIAIALCGISVVDVKEAEIFDSTTYISGVGVYNGQTKRAVCKDEYMFYYEDGYEWEMHSLPYIVFDVTGY